MTSKTSVFTIGVVASVVTLCLAALLIAMQDEGRGASAEASTEASSMPSRPLALMAPAGTARIDHVISRLQTDLRREPRSPEAWVALGNAWERKARETTDPGLYRNVADCAHAASTLSPQHPGAAALRGLVLMDGHRFEEALQLGEGMLERDRDDLAALAIVADASIELGRFDDAARAADRMMDLKPSLPSYARASYLKWLTGDVAGALDAARLAVDAGGDAEPRAWMLVQAGLVFWHRADLDGADAGLDHALAYLPDYAPALVAKGRVALSRGDHRAAISWLEQAWARAPLPETAWLLGDARQGAGDMDGARAAYEDVVRGGRAFDRRTLALFFATKGRDTAEALRLADHERAVRRDVYTEDAYAWALYRAGRLDEAAAAAARATALGTPDARLLYHAGAIRLARGELGSGRATIEAALTLNPAFDFTGAAEARELLERVQ